MLDFAVRRGLEHAGGLHVLKRAISAEHGKVSEFPLWGGFLLAVTGIAFFIFIIVVEYALNYLIATLAAIETPNAAITISAPKESATGEEKEGLLETSPEATLVHEKPITSSIRATLKHLRAESGRRAHLKGFGYHFLYRMVHGHFTHLFFLVVPTNIFTAVVGAAIAGAICAPLHAAWTNKIISKHSNNVTFWQRFPSRSSWKVIAVPAAVFALIPYLEIGLIFVLTQFLNLPKVGEQSRSTVTLAGVAWNLFKFVALVVAVAAANLFLYIPAMATLVRTEASLLSEDQDTVVPFDRTFAGKVVPKSLGGTGVVRFVDAWKSFDSEGRRRVFKHFVKSFFVVVFMFIVIFHVFLLEFLLIMGTSFGPAVKRAVGHP